MGKSRLFLFPPLAVVLAERRGTGVAVQAFYFLWLCAVDSILHIPLLLLILQLVVFVYTYVCAVS